MVALTGPKTANLAIIEGFLTPVPTHLTDQSQILKARVDPWSTLMCQILFESVYAEYCIFFYFVILVLVPLDRRKIVVVHTGSTLSLPLW